MRASALRYVDVMWFLFHILQLLLIRYTTKLALDQQFYNETFVKIRPPLILVTAMENACLLNYPLNTQVLPIVFNIECRTIRTEGGFDSQLAGVPNKISTHFVFLATGSSRQVEICSLENCYVFVICIFTQYCNHFIIGHLHLVVTVLWRQLIARFSRQAWWRHEIIWSRTPIFGTPHHCQNMEQKTNALVGLAAPQLTILQIIGFPE